MIQVPAYLGEIRIIANQPFYKIPSGWALCDGSLIAISDNADLFSLIGTTYGGNGLTTFALPSLCGRLAMGAGTGPGLTPRNIFGQQLGNEAVSIESAHMPVHSHTLNAVKTPASTNTPSSNVTFAQTGNNYQLYLSGNSPTDHSVLYLNKDALASGGESQAHSNLMPSLGLNYIIAIEGIYPVDPGPNSGPMVSNVTPESGPPVAPGVNTGGITVSITGLNLMVGIENSTVKFGDAVATVTGTPTKTNIQVICPGGIGRVPVSISTSAGTSEINPNSYFSYVPSVTNVVPASGHEFGGQEVSVFGTGFLNATAVYFGTVEVPAVNFLSWHDDVITLITPNMSAVAGVMSVTVQATINDTSYTSSAHNDAVFDCNPQVVGISPGYGAAAGGTPVTITLRAFANSQTSYQVLFGKTPGTSVAVQTNAPTITAMAPAGTGIVPVTVTYASHPTTSTSKVSFSYVPVVTSFTPTFGQAQTQVTITGANFSSTSTVLFGTTSVTPSQEPTNTQIVVSAPAVTGSGLVPIAVTGPGGTSVQSKKMSYFCYSPQLTYILPTEGPPAGGSSAVIYGDNLTSNSTIMFGAQPATYVSLNSSGTEMVITTPAGTPDTAVNVQVSTAAGTSNAVTYSYGLQDIGIVSINPTMGPSNGGSPVVIGGYGFGSAPTVNFGTATATIKSVDANGTQIVCDAPAGTGVVNVTVTANGETSAIDIENSFSYVPHADVITPTFGSNQGNTLVTITGEGFVVGQTTVFFGNTQANPQNVSVTNNSLMKVYTPQGTGICPIFVSTPGGMSQGPDFKFFPYISSLHPSSGGYAAGNETIDIEGEGIGGASNVMFGDVPAINFGTYPGKSKLWAISPAAPANATSVDVIVTSGAGTASCVFTYRPMITKISPMGGPAGTQVTITGACLMGVQMVYFGPFAVPANVSDNNNITAVAPGLPESFASVELVVVGDLGSNDPHKDKVFYTYAPYVYSISPTSGWAGTVVNIYGEGFQKITKVQFGTTLCLNWSYSPTDPDHHIIAPAPVINAYLPVAITIDSEYGGSGLHPNSVFTYVK